MTLLTKFAGQRIHYGPRELRRLPEGVESRPYEMFGVEPQSPTIGARVTGVDLAEPLTPALRDELHRALLEWKVLFFPAQNITPAQHKAFAEAWGELEGHPFLPSGDAPDVVRFAKGAMRRGAENNWHTDNTWRTEPSLGAVLRAVEVPELGGATLWADMAAAYDNLPQALRERVDGLVAVHDFRPMFGQGLTPEQTEHFHGIYPPVEHPVVRTHPETGRRTLFVNNQFTTHIVGMDPEEGEELLDLLFQQAAIPEYQVRWTWGPGDVAFWDNRATQHYAVSDYYPQTRVMERVSIVGDRPR